nr:EOG090X0DUK [Cyclestheria hislopi]
MGNITYWNTHRYYSKGKEKTKGDKKKKAHVEVHENEIAELTNIDSLKQDLERALEHLRQDYVKNLSIRSSAGAIENLTVNIDGTKCSLQEIAQVGRKSPQLIVVNVSAFPQAIPSVLKSIQDSGMGLNPQQDGTTIFLPVPKVTREHREMLAKNAKVLFNSFKERVRDIHNKYVRDVKKKEKQVSEDLVFSVQQQIHSMTEQITLEAEKLMVAKQNELLGKD